MAMHPHAPHGAELTLQAAIGALHRAALLEQVFLWWNKASRAPCNRFFIQQLLPLRRARTHRGDEGNMSLPLAEAPDHARVMGAIHDPGVETDPRPLRRHLRQGNRRTAAVS